MSDKKLIGEVTHFFGNLSVAVVELKDEVKKGEKIIIEGATTSFEQKIDSMQINRVDVKEAKKGEAIGLKVKDKVRPGDKVYLVLKNETKKEVKKPLKKEVKKKTLKKKK